MFKTQEKKGTLPTVADLQALTQMPAKVWSMARIALIIWAVFWGVGTVARIVWSFRLMRMNRGEGELAVSVAPQPIYALFNFNIGDKSQPDAE